MATSTQSPTDRIGTPEIPVRRMDFEFDDTIPELWFGGDPVRTMLLTALSCTFPEGERMFMRSVRHFQDRIQDPTLQKQVKAFIGQEAHHGKEHQAFNDMMARKGLPIANIERITKVGLSREESFFSPERMLAKTCALEHFTAMFAEMLLEYPELIDDIDERLKPLWMWHAVEESEHKAVAFDVYKEQVDSYWIRTSEMALTTVLFSFFSTLHTVQLLRSSKGAKAAQNKRYSPGRQLSELWKHREIFGKLGKHYLAYYRPDFHPSQKDSSFLRKKGLKMLKRYVGERALQAA